MSRGLGRLQWRVIHTVCDNQEGIAGLDVPSLNRLLGGDRSNNRRAVRNLLRRGMALEGLGEEGERRVILTEKALISVLMRTPVPPPEPDPAAEERRKRRKEIFEELRERYRLRRRS